MCEVPLLGGGTATGGGTGTGGSGGGGSETGGGAGTGGGSETGGGGGGGMEEEDAGVVIDPFDDGGVFLPGDICSYALPIDFDGGVTATVQIDLGELGDEYVSACSPTSGNDAIFAVTLTQPQALRVTASNTGPAAQDPVLAVLSSPCAAYDTVACIDATGGAAPEVLDVDNLGAGTWYVLLDNYRATDQSTYEVTFDLLPPLPVPANDTCAAAEALVFTSDVATAMGTTVGARNDNATEPLSCSSSSATGRDVFYRFTLAQPQDVVVEVTSSDISPAVAILTACSGGNEPACGAGSSFSPARLRKNNLPAGDYVVVVDSTSAATGAFALTVTLSAPTPPPGNDVCDDAVELLPNATVMVNLNDATRDYEQSCASFSRGGDVVYSITLTQPSGVRIEADQSTTDVVLALRAAPCEDASSDLACVDSFSSVERIERSYLAPGTYYVVVSAYYDDDIPGTTGISLTLTPPVFPPSNDTCSAPETLVPGVTLMVNASSALPDYGFDDCIDPPENDVVYTFTLTQPQRVGIEAIANPGTDVMIELRSGTCDTGAVLGCANEIPYQGYAESLVQSVLPAGTYFVIVGSATTTGIFGLSLTLGPVATPATNDTCMTAATLVPGVSVNVDASAAAADLEDPSCLYDPDFEPVLHDVVYTFTTTSAQRAELNAYAGPSTNVVLSLRSGACDPGTELGCRERMYLGGNERLVVPDLPAGTYWVTLSADTAGAELGVSLSLGAPVAPPGNDSCAAPEVVTFTNGTATRSLNLEGALPDFVGAGSCATGAEGADVVYEVTIPANQTLTVVATPGAVDVDAVLVAFTGTCASGTQVACADNTLPSYPETITVANTTASPMTVFVVVQEYVEGVEGPLTVDFTLQ